MHNGKTYYMPREVEAKPCKVKDARYEKHDTIVPQGYADDSEGYVVEDAFLKRYWMPKLRFEQNFLPADDWKERLKREYYEVGKRLYSLNQFIYGRIFSQDPCGELVKEVGAEQAMLLQAQLYTLEMYRDILRHRCIEAELFDEDEESGEDND